MGCIAGGIAVGHGVFPMYSDAKGPAPSTLQVALKGVLVSTRPGLSPDSFRLAHLRLESASVALARLTQRDSVAAQHAEIVAVLESALAHDPPLAQRLIQARACIGMLALCVVAYCVSMRARCGSLPFRSHTPLASACRSGRWAPLWSACRRAARPRCACCPSWCTWCPPSLRQVSAARSTCLGGWLLRQ